MNTFNFEIMTLIILFDHAAYKISFVMACSFCRNEVWRYEGYRGIGMEAFHSVFRGFKYAVGLMVVTVVVRDFVLSKDKGHGEDHH